MSLFDSGKLGLVLFLNANNSVFKSLSQRYNLLLMVGQLLSDVLHNLTFVVFMAAFLPLMFLNNVLVR